MGSRVAAPPPKFEWKWWAVEILNVGEASTVGSIARQHGFGSWLWWLLSCVTVSSHWVSHSFSFLIIQFSSVQFSSVAQSCPTLCDPMNLSMPGLPVHHHLPEFTQTHVHQVRDTIQPSHPRSSPSPPAPNPSQHQSLFQWVNSPHEVAKVLEFQLQHHSLQRNPRADLLQN